MSSESPYASLPPEAFWRSGVAERDTLDPGKLYKPKFPILRKMRVVTAGSCFAQHVGRNMKKAGFSVQDAEPISETNDQNVSDATAHRFGYRLYSARYGNIYTAAQLKQLQLEAQGILKPAEPVWEKGGRFFDSQRPSVEPDGLPSPAHVEKHRAYHLAQVRKVFKSADVFVFTFGLTEAWVHSETKTVYPTAPGTIAGQFDGDAFEFHNFGFSEILADFLAFRKRLMKAKPNVRFLVTVSPVPLTATCSGQHVEVATAYSKSVLRAVCGELYATCENVDYFPSFEIITSQNARGCYYGNNMRSVSDKGVETAMRVFFEAHGVNDLAPPAPEDRSPKASTRAPKRKTAALLKANDELVCEDVLLEAFSR